MKNHKNQRVEFGVMTYSGVQSSSVMGMTDIFKVANQFISVDHDLIRISHWQKLENSLVPARIFDTMNGEEGIPDVMIIPSVLGSPQLSQNSPHWISWLHRYHAQGGVLASVCVGAFVLAETGLLDKRTATTHWMYEQEFKSRYPKVNLNIDHLIIDDGDIITAGGALAWIDLSLRLIERFYGPSVMFDTARFLLVDPPSREQRYYSLFSPRFNHGDLAVLKAQHWLHENRASKLSLRKIAQVAKMHERTFQRRFIKATGLTPTEYHQQLRVAKARELIEQGNGSIESVAWSVGYQDVGAFRKVFFKIVGLSPTDYRRRFGK